MNGAHDVGGMHGLGAIEREEGEPVFHAPWEGRVYALTRAMRAWRKWNLDSDRYALEILPAVDYFRLSYYERWFVRLVNQVVRFGFATSEELEDGTPAVTAAILVPALNASMSSRFVNRGLPSADQPSVKPLFRVGQRVRARNLNPETHTRLPRYARGKRGTIVIDHGVYSFPDTNALFVGEKRQHVYSVRFTARELWGESASARDFMHLDLWDDYLERT